MRLFKIIVNWTPKIWLPLAIVLLTGVINLLARLHLFAYLDLDLFTISPIIVGFLAIVGELIDWLLISALLFFGCRLLYKGEGVFQNFLKMIGMCYLVLLVATLSHFIFLLTSLPPDLTTSSQASSEAVPEALAALELPIQVINIAGYICFVLILVPVVQTFFQIRWVQALCNVCLSYAIYWILNKALWYIFSSVFFFFYQQFFDFPSWQPGDPIRP